MVYSGVVLGNQGKGIAYMPRISAVVNSIRVYRHRRRINNLVRAGLQIGKDVNILPDVHLDVSYPYLIKIGNNVSIGYGSRILAHDASPYSFLGVARIGAVEIRNHSFLGEYVIVLPGVKIGPRALVTAGSLVTRDVPPNSRVSGVPARVYGKFDDFIKESRFLAEGRECVPFEEIAGPLTPEQKKSLREKTNEGILCTRGYVGVFPYAFNPSGIPPEDRFEAYPGDF